MKIRLVLACLMTLVAASMAVPAALAATSGAGSPSITILSPQSGATLKGSTVTVRVAVSNFKLVPPVYLNPPKLSGNQGHIHYVLDGNFVATRDAAVSLSHTWTNVAPGHHMVVAYLATSQHAMFPGTQEAKAPVMVVAASTATQARTTAVKSSAKSAAKGPGVTAMPRTGGAVAAGHSGLSLSWLLLAFAAIATSVILGWRRMVWARM